MPITVEEFSKEHIKETIEIWNSVVLDGSSFPQIECLDEGSGLQFFSSQSFTGIALDGNHVVGVYILHPNNIGRCGHICNASYAVDKSKRGQHIGEELVKHSIEKAKELTFRILQFNAVVSTNYSALALYKKLGFTQLGTIPNGFFLEEGKYQDIIPHYLELV